MITIQAHTIFGEVTHKFDTTKDAMEWIEVNLANKVPFSSWSNEVALSFPLAENDELLIRKIFAYRHSHLM